jgi:hypothetical protein
LSAGFVQSQFENNVLPLLTSNQGGSMKQLSIVTALALALAASPALADEGQKLRVKLSGAQEVPFVSTPGNASFEAVINKEGTHIDWTLTYADMQSDVSQAHVHIGQFRVNGAIVLWICKTTQTAPANVAVCPGLRNGTVSGTWSGADVQTVTTQGFAPGELDEVIAAIRAGAAYANVHTAASPGGEIRGQLGSRRGRGHDGHQYD